MAIYHIYKITNLITNEVYIGKTKQSLEARFKKHCASSDCPSLHEAILDYGRKNFKIELLEECEEENSSEIESKYIKQYDSIKKGYNNSYSVPGYRTEEETKIISQEKEAKRKRITSEDTDYFINFVDFIAAKEYFKTHKDEILSDERLFKRRGGGMKYYTDEQMYNINLCCVINDLMKINKRVKPIYQYDVNLQFLKTFNTGNKEYSAAKSLNLNNKDLVNTQSFITEVARGRKRLGYGYIWSYLNPFYLYQLVNILKGINENENESLS